MYTASLGSFQKFYSTVKGLITDRKHKVSVYSVFKKCPALSLAATVTCLHQYALNLASKKKKLIAIKHT